MSKNIDFMNIINSQSFDAKFKLLLTELNLKYGDDLFNIDGIGEQLDTVNFSKQFYSTEDLATADVSVDANANVGKASVTSYRAEAAKPMQRLNSYYMTWKYGTKLYGRDIANAIVTESIIGDYYIHDFHDVAAGLVYCANYSLYDVMVRGLPFVEGIKVTPANHLAGFLGQVALFSAYAANSTSGATGLNDLFVIMSYYVEKMLKTKTDSHFTFATEEDCWTYVKESLVNRLYEFNCPTRSYQSAFINVTVYDKPFLEVLCKEYIFPDGSTPNIPIIQRIQEIYMEAKNEMLDKSVHTFPVTAASFVVNEQTGKLEDKEFAKLVAKYNTKYMYMNIYCGPPTRQSFCCRIQLDTNFATKEEIQLQRDELNGTFFNSFGSGSSKVGGIGNVTLNLPRIALKSYLEGETQKEREEIFFEKLNYYYDMTARINNIKRYIIKDRIKNGNYPLFTYEFMDMNTLFSICGINGMYEAMMCLGYDVQTEEGINFAYKMCDVFSKAAERNTKQYKFPHGLEQTPAESVSVKLPKKR